MKSSSGSSNNSDISINHSLSMIANDESYRTGFNTPKDTPQLKHDQLRIDENSNIPQTEEIINFWTFKPDITHDNDYTYISSRTVTTNTIAPSRTSQHQSIELPELLIVYDSSSSSVGIEEDSLTTNMFDIIEDLTISPVDRKRIIDLAATNPPSLIGYQV